MNEIEMIISGKLIYQPKRILNRYGKPYVIAKLNIEENQNHRKPINTLNGFIRVDVIAFDERVSAYLMGLQAGALVCLAGVVDLLMEKDEYLGAGIVLKLTAWRVISEIEMTRMNQGKGLLSRLLP